MPADVSLILRVSKKPDAVMLHDDSRYLVYYHLMDRSG